MKPYVRPLLSVTDVEAKGPLQRRKLDDLILSHVDTLTRSGSSKVLLPTIGARRASPSPPTDRAESRRINE